MQNILSKIFASVLFTAIMIGIVALSMVNTDGNVQTLILEEAANFVDNARAYGKITKIEYDELVSFMGMCGEFEATISIERRTSYPITTTDAAGNTVYTGQYDVAYMTVAHDDIIEYMFDDTYGPRDFLLNTGDRIKVQVRRTGPGFTSIAGLFKMSGKAGQIITTYSGTVYHDGN